VMGYVTAGRAVPNPEQEWVPSGSGSGSRCAGGAMRRGVSSGHQRGHWVGRPRCGGRSALAVAGGLLTVKQEGLHEPRWTRWVFHVKHSPRNRLRRGLDLSL
jgi:hypothetical protein